MKRAKSRKALSIFLVIVMITSLCGLYAQAEDSGGSGQGAGTETLSQSGDQTGGQINGGTGEQDNDETDEQDNDETDEQDNDQTDEQDNDQTDEQDNDQTDEQDNDQTDEQDNDQTDEQDNDQTDNLGKEVSKSDTPKLVFQQPSQTIDGVTVQVSGMLPEGIALKVNKVDVSDVSLGDVEVLYAYDISLWLNGKEYEITNTNEVTVSFINVVIPDAESVEAYHIDDNKKVDEIGVTANASKGVATMTAQSFSIYAIASAPKTITYQYYNEDTLLGTQKVKTGDTLLEPAVPTVTGKKFIGWYTAATGGTEFTSFGTVGTITDFSPVKLYARFEDAYYVFFMDDTGRICATKNGADGDEIDTRDVTFSVGANKAVTGWSLTNPATVPVSDKVIINKANINLYPIVKSVYWVAFESNGGSFVAPVFGLPSSTISNLPTPTRNGYTFEGWWNNAGFTGNKVTSVTSAATLYAKWKGAQVNYTVVYWQENAEDNGYSFVESTTKKGTAGTAASYDNKSYTGFNLNTSKTNAADNIVTISGDGTSIKNVYYSRNTWTLTFQIYQKTYDSPWGSAFDKYDWVTVKSYTLKYNQNTAAKWAEASAANKGYSWKTTKHGDIGYSGAPLMPNGNLTVYGRYSEEEERVIKYISTPVSGSGTTEIAPATHMFIGDFSFTQEDLIGIKGFTCTSTVNGMNRANWNGNPKTKSIQYSRNTYYIEFNTNGGPAVAKIQNILFEQSIANQSPVSYIVGTTTKTVNGQTYYFAGWYDNAACAGAAYSFAGKTMPANNLILYAKWATSTYTVTFDANGGTPAPSSVKVASGETVTEPEAMTKADYKFVGWYNGNKLFNFGTNITNSITLTAHWISIKSYTVTYAAGEAAGTAPTDSNSYAEGSYAQIKDSTGLTAPDGKVFVGWLDGESIYYPNSSIQIPASNVVLTAQWANKAATTSITYKANDGTESNVTDNNLVINGETTLRNSGFTRAGFKLDGWSKRSTGSKDFDLGETVVVDNLAADDFANTLYAVWKADSSQPSPPPYVGPIGYSDPVITSPSVSPSPSESTIPETEVPQADVPVTPIPEAPVPGAVAPVIAPTNTPQTGDNSNILLLAILAVLSAAGLGTVGIVTRKKKHNK